MEGEDHSLPISTVSSTLINEETSASSSWVREEEERREEQEEIGEQLMHVSYLPTFSIPVFDTSTFGDDAWSCLAVLISFWFFAASMTLMLGLYGSESLKLGPNCSRLFQANSFFVKEIKVQELTRIADEITLYGLSSLPTLDVKKTWSGSHYVSLTVDAHKEWLYFLNGGSQVNITYHVKSPSSSPVSLVIAKGRESLIDWIDDPSYPNITLSWNLIQGSGMIQQKIVKSSDYYIAVGNLYPGEVEVELDIRIQSVLYDTSNAYYKCSLNNGSCGVQLLFLEQNAAVLTSSIPEVGTTSSEEGYVKLIYEPRWISYFVVSGAITIFALIAFKICTRSEFSNSDESGLGAGVVGSERTPLIAPKDDNLSSWGSSYDSLPMEDEDLEDQFIRGSLETKLLKDGENPNSRRLCAICFDATRDCFFLPCGHCATCFECATRIVEEAGICPICRRKTRKVRKIFTV